MMFIQYKDSKTGKEKTIGWHTGEPFSSIYAGTVTEILVDGDELNFIVNSGLVTPQPPPFTVIRFFGDQAKFIAGNMEAAILHAKRVKFTAIDAQDRDCQFTLADFTDMVKQGAVVNYDGSGYYATAEDVSNVQIDCAGFMERKHPEWATHVMWYNK